MAFQAARIAILLLLSTVAVAANDRQPAPQDLKLLTIEELMEIDITVATREPEMVRNTAAAISVVTREDIHRAGVTTLADAVALADGVHVARINNGSWAVSARGFNATSANKLLVMIDGRTEYSPLFTGTFWNMLDYVLEDVDRIEVIRGPGAALWGANAVNGVVNIITRHSRDTQGAHIALGSGNEDPALADVRYGGVMARSATYRLYAKYAHRDEQVFATGEPSQDARRRGQLGFRVDGGAPDADTWLLKGDAFHSRDEFSDRADGEFTGLALQGRWSHRVASESRLDLQSYYRREYRRVPAQLTHQVDTIDFDLQHGFTWRARHRVVWGATQRFNWDSTEGGSVRFEPPEARYSLSSLFAQDEIALIPARLYVVAGMKMERNSFTGPEWQPNVRSRFHISPRQMIWGAVSRAVRRPTRLDVDVRTATATGGGDAFRAETLLAGELGYRVQPHARVSLDATVFTHGYDDLRSQELPPTGPPIVVGNTLNARVHGLELTGNLQPAAWWRIHVSYTYLDESITRDADSRDVGRTASEANDPRHQAGARASLDLPGEIEADAVLRRVGELPNPRVPAYTELNARVGWRATPRLELAVIGQDLLHAHHPEFGADTPRRVEFERSVRAMVTIRY